MLNKGLHDRLQEIFGDVGITNEDSNAELSFKYPPTLSGSIKVQWEIKEGSTGEWYTVKCPYCRDRSKHLNISYLSFSAPKVEGYQTDPKGLIANCFHGCLYNHPERLVQLSQLIKMEPTQLVVEKSTKQETHDELSDTPDLPGILSWCPDYHPIEEGSVMPNMITSYIESRKWSIPQLHAVRAGWGSVCSYTSGTMINQGVPMLIFPFIQRKQLKGFQARAPFDKETCEAKNMLRWYTHPAMKKTAVLYNFDNAVNFPMVCVSEGVTDVLGIGPYSVGTMGTTAAKYQMQLLAANWADGYAIWLPDRKLIHNADGSVTDPVDLAEAKVKEANSKGYFKYGAYVVKLSGDDPGSMSQQQIWEEIWQQCPHLPTLTMSRVLKSKY